MDEQKAIQRLKQGDLVGLEYLVQKYQVKAVRTAQLITRDPALAEDVVQECFLQAARSIEHYDPARPFEPWFMRSVLNRAIKTAQQSNRQPITESDLDVEWFENLPERLKSVEAEMDELAFQEEVRSALEQLSPRQRAVIVQRYFLEWSEKEMAENLSIAPGTVKWLLNAAKNRLRTLFGERSVR